jgi:hypothetical protein
MRGLVLDAGPTQLLSARRSEAPGFGASDESVASACRGRFTIPLGTPNESSGGRTTVGSRKAKREAFFAANPMCCFCGGSERATTEDHIPSRAMFRGKAWPEGYSFPACDRCQGASSKDEMLVSLLSRMAPGKEAENNPEELRYFEVLLRAANNNFPGILQSFNLMTAREKRQWLEGRDFKLPPGMSIADLPIASVRDPRIEAAIVNFARKLFLALYYFHTRKIIPLQGGARFRWWTNANDLSAVSTPEVLSLLSRFPTLKRAKTPLDDQFSYRYSAPSDNPALYVFRITFNNSFIMLGAVGESLADVAFNNRVLTVTPYGTATSHDAELGPDVA